MVTVKEMSRRESFADGAVTISRKFDVTPYSGRAAVLEALLGGVILIEGQLVRILPARDPWFPYCWCTSAEVEPFDVLNSPGNVASGLNALYHANSANVAHITATYKTLDRVPGPTGAAGQQPAGSAQQEVELASESWDFSGRNLTLKNQFWKWPDDKLLVRTETAVTKTLPKINFTLVRHFCLRKPVTAIRRLIGRVNKSPFGIEGERWAKETLLFAGLQAARKIMSRGVPFWDLSFRFDVEATYDHLGEYQPSEDPNNPGIWRTAGQGFVGWNRLFRQDESVWAYPTLVKAIPVGPGQLVNNMRRTIYLYDEDVEDLAIKGQKIKGFNQLFHPGAT